LKGNYNEPALWRDKSESWHEIMPGVKRRIANHASTGMMVYYKIEPGRIFPRHNHPHAQFGLFIEGQGIFKVGNESWEIKAGDGYFIPPGVFHELATTGSTPSIAVDFFTPERDEYLSESPVPDS